MNPTRNDDDDDDANVAEEEAVEATTTPHRIVPNAHPLSQKSTAREVGVSRLSLLSRWSPRRPLERTLTKSAAAGLDVLLRSPRPAGRDGSTKHKRVRRETT